jgi:predicted nucleic acid-binding protein
MKLLLDTSVLIDVLRFRKQRREWLAQLARGGHTFSTTVLNVAEVYAGMRPGEESQTGELLAGLESYEIDGTAARVAGKLKSSWAKKGRTLTLTDAIIAAITIERGCALVTDNRKDFPMAEVRLYPLP